MIAQPAEECCSGSGREGAAAGAAGEHRPEAGSLLRRRDRAHREVGPSPGSASAGWAGTGGVWFGWPEALSFGRVERPNDGGRRVEDSVGRGMPAGRRSGRGRHMVHRGTSRPSPGGGCREAGGERSSPRVIRLLGVGLHPSRRVVGQVTLVVAAAGRLPQSLVMGEPPLMTARAPAKKTAAPTATISSCPEPTAATNNPALPGSTCPTGSIVPSDLGISIRVSPNKRRLTTFGDSAVTRWKGRSGARSTPPFPSRLPPPWPGPERAHRGDPAAALRARLPTTARH